MKSKSFQLLTLLLFFVIPIAKSQLSGYYTIGGDEANYQTLSAALSDLYQMGLSGDVTFALNTGTYPGISFSDIPGSSDENRFVLESATLDSTDVIFNGTIGFDEAKFITIKAITISTYSARVIEFVKSKHIFIQNCIFNSEYQPGYPDGTIYISHYWPDQGEYSHITLDHCIINSNSPSIYCVAYNGSTTINNCEINSTGVLAMKAKWSERVNINNSILNGGIDIESNVNSSLRNNLINGEIEIGFLDSLLNNTFISNETFHVAARYFKGNYFSQQSLQFFGYSTTNCVKYIDNYIEGYFHIPHATNINMIGNTFLDDVSLSFNKILIFENNKIFGDLNYGNTNGNNCNYRLHNNIFINSFVHAKGHNSIISYNNFVDNALLFIYYSNILVYDNNFCGEIQGYPTPGNVNHNNYFPLIYCYYDTNSTHYDPVYLENNPGIATNLMLQGKGWSDAPETDFLGNSRKNPPAIGANEIYVCSDSMNNLINVPCGDELYLNMCSLQDTGIYWWTPDTCILCPDSIYTVVSACESMTWYLNNSIYGLVDSVSIQVVPFEVQIAEMPLFYCGYARTLNASYHPFASYHWEPEDGLTNPNIRNPILLIEDTNNLQYVLECQVSGCGVSSDTLNIDFDPLPNVGIYYPQQNADTIFFTCISTCVDEYLWDFGDGTFSAEENPFHIFPENGTYTITLTGTNSFGSNSHTVNYNYYWVSSFAGIESEKIMVFPNPANERIFIKGLPDVNEVIVTLLNLSGNIILHSKFQTDQPQVNIQDLDKGVYIMQIQYNETIVTKKIIVLP